MFHLSPSPGTPPPKGWSGLASPLGKVEPSVLAPRRVLGSGQGQSSFQELP